MTVDRIAPGGHVENDVSMWVRHPLARRDVLASMAGLGLGALLPGSLGASSARADNSTRASGNHGVTLMNWSEYLELLEPAGDVSKRTWEPDSEQVRAEVYRQLVMNISLGYFMYFQHDPNYPDWIPFLNSVFMLQPNPDDTYYLARIDPNGTYRITGERGSVHILTFVLGGEPMGTTERIGGSGNSLQFDGNELQLDDDGRFEVILSAERPAGHTGDWHKLGPTHQTILARQRSYNWGVERDARLAIERLDLEVGALKPRMPAQEIDKNLRDLLGGFTERLSRIWVEYQNKFLGENPVNEISFTSFGGAVPVQVYWQGVFQLAPDEALILETDIPKRHRYWNVQLNDTLFNAVEFIYRQSSLNGHQATLDADGKFRGVITLNDPGVPNWLDCGGYLQGMVIGRWYEADSHPVPTLKRVPFKDIRKHLHPDTPVVTPDQRAAILSARREGGQLRRRW